MPNSLRECRNGLHEIDPGDEWRGPNGARCRECYIQTQDRYNASEKGRERVQRWREEKRDAWLCTNCGKEPLLSDLLGWDCLSKQQDRNVFRF